jgi:hypothetical protein
VTIPAVPPYSSMTMAMWKRSSCIWRSRAGTFFVSGTKTAGRRRVDTASAPASSRSARIRSFA